LHERVNASKIIIMNKWIDILDRAIFIDDSDTIEYNEHALVQSVRRIEHYRANKKAKINDVLQ
jgi:hypothetical protein